MSKVALITGITGQDGSYLAEFLLEKGYEVHGLRRRSSSFNTGRITSIIESGKLPVENLHHGDLSDFSSCNALVHKIQPDEIYHLAAQSHVGVSFETPEYTGNIDALGTLRMLEVLRSSNNISTKFYQASTSELYGNNDSVPQNESTTFMPCSPYAIAKLYSYQMAVLYREAYGIFAANGILFNHESPRRGETFVTRKITRFVANYSKGKEEILTLGNLDAVRDWGHAKDYVAGMYLILQHSAPSDFVLATGQGRTVREFVELAFKLINIEICWSGEGVNEFGFNKKSGKKIVVIDSGYFRAKEVPKLIGDATKARKILGWQSTINFETLVQEMVDSDLKLLNS